MQGPEGLGRIIVDELWAEASDRMFEFLGAIALASLAAIQWAVELSA